MKDWIEQELHTHAEEGYRDFHARLLPPDTKLLGVRLPTLRKLTARIVREGEAADFLSRPCGELLEEKLLRGMVIGAEKCTPEQRMQQLTAFLPLIDNWAVCDSTCAGLKDVKLHKEEYRRWLLPLLRSREEYTVRFGVVLLLDYYSKGDDVPGTLEALEGVSHPGYYVRMAVAWALSVCYVHETETTWQWLKIHSLDPETRRMTVRKILDSRRVTGMAREQIRGDW